MPKRALLISIAVIVSMLVYWLVPADITTRKGLAVFAFIGILWITEALHLTVTALLVPIVAIIIGLADAKYAFSHFANPIIFLFLGGFVLATALQKHSIDNLLANKVLSLSRGKPLVAIILLFAVTAFLSMWISNTATAAMMLPLALGLLSKSDVKSNPKLFLFVLLGLAYSANLGGIATLIGSPPNAIAASAAGFRFNDWLKWGIPVFLILFPIMIAILYFLYRPKFSQNLYINHFPLKLNPQKIIVIGIFILTALCWIFGAPLSEILNISKSFDSIVAVCAIVALVGTNSVHWKDIQTNVNWGILVLFGGGIALSSILNSSGASDWLANQLVSVLPIQQEWLLLLIISLFVVFLTELVSNTASAALLIPIFMSVAHSLNISPTGIAILIALCASCAFMLPVATPPNAIVFGSGFIRQKDMMRAGLIINLMCAIIISSIAYIMIH